jgi:predicted nucleic acid-binding protein
MILTDSGFWLALFNRRDRHHARAKRIMASLDEPLITTLPVITETAYLLLRRNGTQKAIEFIHDGRKGLFALFEFRLAHFDRAAVLMRQYADLPMDLADASLVVLAEELGHGRILSTDQRDFQTYRWKSRHPFQNLFEE